MKTISMREFQLNAPSYLKDLPLTLTRYGEPVASVIPCSPKTPLTEYKDAPEHLIVNPTPASEVVEAEKEEKVEKELKTIWLDGKKHFIDEDGNEVFEIFKKVNVKKLKKELSSLPGYCKHGAAIGNCKFGCTK